MERWNDFILIQNQTKNSFANTLNIARSQDITDNRKHVYYLLKVTHFLAKHGLAFRGHYENCNSNNRGNFIELLDMFVDGDDVLKVKFSSRYGHYTSPEYQNDLIHILAYCTRKQIIKNMSNFNVFTIMVVETKDALKKEQLSFIIRFVDRHFNVNEKALGCYHMKKSYAESLFQEIIKIVADNKLDINMCVAQCYDGANVISGSYSGVQKIIQSIVNHSLYVHCYAHRLNFCLVHTLNNIPIITGFF